MGAIIRTCAEGADAKAIMKDLLFLSNTWHEIEKKYSNASFEEKIYEDIDLVLQIVRDHLDDAIESIVVDNEKIQSEIYKFIRAVTPEYSHVVKLYNGNAEIFEHFNLEKQIQSALERKVHLKSGGSLIIETTEAMTVIDVNTGKFIGKTNLEETIVKTNLEAVHEIARQIRLRNIGGLIVIDFIDMSVHANKQKVFKTFEKILKEKDKFQSVVLKISEFGLVQMTRKRSGKTLMQQFMHLCGGCRGLGYVKSTQTLTYDIFRHLKKELMHVDKSKQVILQVHPLLFEHITSFEYQALLDLEKLSGTKIVLATNESLNQSHYMIVCKD
jgi:ribonuclease G